MSNIIESIIQISSLETLAQKKTPIHKLQPFPKLIITILYLIVVISSNPYQISGLIPYVIYPIIIMTLGDIPFKPLFQRVIIVLPFTIIAGFSNVIFNQRIAFYIWNIEITEGVISFTSIIIKTILTVMAVLILIATTSMNDLFSVMILIKIPSIIVIQIMMTYRYLSILADEISTMYQAYILRAPKEKGIKLIDMGPFLGHLIVRSFDRAENIYNAMKCRGFEGNLILKKRNIVDKKGYIYIIAVGSVLILLRFINISDVIGRLFV